jgi:hypothetical protein
MQAVILALLLVAGSLVHSAPQEAVEGGKWMYKYKKGYTDFINAVDAIGYSSILRDMGADTQARNLTYRRLLQKWAFYSVDVKLN